MKVDNQLQKIILYLLIILKANIIFIKKAYLQLINNNLIKYLIQLHNIRMDKKHNNIKILYIIEINYKKYFKNIKIKILMRLYLQMMIIKIFMIVINI